MQQVAEAMPLPLHSNPTHRRCDAALPASSDARTTGTAVTGTRRSASGEAQIMRPRSPERAAAAAARGPQTEAQGAMERTLHPAEQIRTRAAAALVAALCVLGFALGQAAHRLPGVSRVPALSSLAGHVGTGATVAKVQAARGPASPAHGAKAPRSPKAAPPRHAPAHSKPPPPRPHHHK